MSPCPASRSVARRFAGLVQKILSARHVITVHQGPTMITLYALTQSRAYRIAWLLEHLGLD